MEFRYDALGRRVETIEYVDPATGAAFYPARRTRHVYFGLEVIQEYACGGGDGSGAPSNCCEPHGGPGCDNEECWQAVCAIPGYEHCCDEELGGWNSGCEWLARNVYCQALCDGVEPGDPGCSDYTLQREFLHGDPERYPEVVAMLTYTWGTPPGPNPTSQPPGPQLDGVYHYLHDVLGSVIGLVDEAGALVERYTYDPYGKVFIETWDPDASTWVSTGNSAFAVPHSAFENPFLWTGHRYDAAVGLYQTHFRFYDPTLGRWLQRDREGYVDGISLYEYVTSSPLGFYDPDGGRRKTIIVIGSIAGAIGGGILVDRLAGWYYDRAQRKMEKKVKQLGVVETVKKHANTVNHDGHLFFDRTYQVPPDQRSKQYSKLTYVFSEDGSILIIANIGDDWVMMEADETWNEWGLGVKPSP